MFDPSKTDGTLIEGGDPALQIRRGIVALAEEDRTYWTGSAKSERLLELLAVRERIDAEILRLTGEWDRDRAWEIDGSLSPKAWLTYRASVTNRQAGQLVKQARLVERHKPIATALADGDVTTAHVDAIGRVTSKEREPLLAEHAEMLVEQAQQLPLSDFTKVVRHWATLADDQLAKQEFLEKWERRHLHISTGLDGWSHIDGFLDPAASANLINALDHLAPPDPEDSPDGPRTLSQRRADGLADLTRHYLNGDKPLGNTPMVNTVIDVASALGTKPELAAIRCEIEGIGPVAQTVLHQMCCNARFSRFIMAGESLILDMGRSTRDATPAQRRALVVRDRHCVFSSCDRQPKWCDVHHIEGWVADLGETNIDNLVLLCRRHHTLVHNSRWTIKRTADGDFEFIHPARGP